MYLLAKEELRLVVADPFVESVEGVEEDAPDTFITSVDGDHFGGFESSVRVEPPKQNDII